MEKGLRLIAGVFALVLTLSVLVSAFTFTTTPSSLPVFSKVGQNETITINSEENFNVSPITNNRFTIVMSENTSNINSTSFTATLNSLSEVSIGQYSENVISLVNSSDPLDEEEISLNYVKSFCKEGPMNASELILEVKVKNNGEGSIDEWQPLDPISVEVRLFNEDDDKDLRDVMFQIGLIKKGTSRDVIEDMIWISPDEAEYEAGDIDGGDKSSKYTFEFRVNPSEVELGEDYYFVVKAYPDGKESTTCIDFSDGLNDLGSTKYFGEVKIASESSSGKRVIIDEYSLQNNPLVAQCGRDVNLHADVFNVGTKDFEDKIKVVLFNQELGIEVEDVIIGDLDSGEMTTTSLSFRVPSDASEKMYSLSMRTYYDYRENNDDYRYISDKTFTAYLKVEGNCAVSAPTLNAELFSGESKEGSEVVIKVYLKNEDTKSANFILSAEEYNSWANLIEIEPQTFTLEGGESKEVLVTLKLKGDSAGEREFKLVATSNGQTLITKPVLLSVEEGSLFEDIGFKSWNWQLIGIVALNVILLVVIIIVARRVLKKH
ncbi:MAG: putative S-layer protein [Nanoarchaeota archaeon]|nr:putative S-layer protein [Nanoarchaeota archaeon]